MEPAWPISSKEANSPSNPTNQHEKSATLPDSRFVADRYELLGSGANPSHSRTIRWPASSGDCERTGLLVVDSECSFRQSEHSQKRGAAAPDAQPARIRR